MVAHLVRLKLLLLRNIFKRSRAQAIGAVLGILYGASVVVLAAGGVAALRGSLADARIFVPLAGAVLVIIWSLLPIFAFGSDPTLDPGRFATFAVPYRQLAAGLVLGGVVGLPGIATCLVVAATVVTWSHTILATAVALVAAAVAVLTCVTLSRWVSGLATNALTSRRGRDLSAVLALGVILIVSAAAVMAGNLTADAAGALRAAGTVAGWTPVGWVWAAPGDFAAGEYVAGAVRLALSVGFLVLLGALWQRTLTAQVESPNAVTRTDAVSAADDLGALGRTPDSQAGAVAGQVATYYRRDPRYQAALFMTPFIPLALLIPYHLADLTWAPLLMAPVAAYFLAWGEHNSVSYESTAFWIHVAAGTPGRADRLGRLAVNAVLVAVLVPAYALAGVWISDRFDLLAPIVGVSAAFVGAGYGLSCILSVVLPYPVAKPGDSPFSSPPGAAGITLAAQTVASLGTALLTAPTLLLAWLTWTGRDWALWPTALSGVLIGAGIFLLGLRIGSRLYERRGPELLQSLVRG